jgi:hypothetical protein
MVMRARGRAMRTKRRKNEILQERVEKAVGGECEGGQAAPYPIGGAIPFQERDAVRENA